MTSGPFSWWYFLLLTQRIFWYYFSRKVMAILCCVAQKAASAAQRQQNLGVDKKLVQMQKNPLTVWLGRVHNCWLLPDLAEDILRFPDGVALFACSRQVWRCLWSPCFYGWSLSRTVPAYCTSPPCWKRHKFWRRQNIGVGLKFTLFCPVCAKHS